MNKPHVMIRGAAALCEMLDCIGAIHPSGAPIVDHDIAKIMVENEMNLRALLEFAILAIADEMG